MLQIADAFVSWAGFDNNNKNGTGMSASQKPELERRDSPFDALLDSRRITMWQWGVLAVVMLVLIVDGLDIQLLSLVAPAILEEWGTSRASFGIAMSAALAGMAVGSGLGGFLGDRYGKKTVLLTAMFFFGLCTIAASLAETVYQLAAVRLLSGIGFGAAAPVGVALASEWLPPKVRAGSSALLSIGTPLGGILGASAVLALLGDIGWRGCFVVCGVLTLMLALASLPLLPESPSLLSRRGQKGQASNLVRKVVGADFSFDEQAAVDRQGGGNPASSGGLFAASNMRLNAGSWLLFFSLQFIAYAFAAWSPVFLTVAGFTIEQAVTTTLAFNCCAVGSALVSTGTLGRFGSRVPLYIASFGAAIGIVLMTSILGSETVARSANDTLLAAVASGVAGGATGLGIATIYGLLAYSYPSEYRSSGIGTGMMMGRIGGICIALFGGGLLALQGSNTQPFFWVLVAVAVAALIGAILIDRHVPGRA